MYPCCRDVVGPGLVPGWVYRVGTRVGYTGYYPATARAEVLRNPDSEAGPGSPSGAGVGGQGGGRTDPFAYPSRTTPRDVRTHPCGARSVPPAGALPGAPRAKGRDSVTFPVKLVKTTECHRKSMKRPVIVPILKTASESHLLIFWVFHICQPSLTRN